MPRSYWMVVKSPENFQIARQRGFDSVGLRAEHRRKVQRMEPGDRVLIYVSKKRVFGATASVTSPLVEEQTSVWKEEGGSNLPYRVGIKPDVVLTDNQYIDADQIAPRMDYTRRWIPELWYMAFQGSLHLVSKFDFNLIEEEMRKLKRGIATRSPEKSSRHPVPLSNCKLDQHPQEISALPTPRKLDP